MGRTRALDGSELLLAAALAGGATQVQAAERTGMSTRTIRRHLAKPEFVAMVERMRIQTAEEVLEILRESAVGAVQTLVELTRPPTPDQVRLGAAKALLDQQLRFAGAVDVERRLRALEAADDAIDIRAT
jgi:hypothetical protein